jgi:tRNA-Thr(GGU) m(6)t(6)A37 methyltransferase TsaA
MTAGGRVRITAARPLVGARNETSVFGCATREARRMEIAMTPVAFVRGGRVEVADDEWGGVSAHIVLDGLPPEALLGLDAFSHVEVLFVFDRVDPDGVCRGARHPRGRDDWPLVGILAQRAKDRPNRIGSTVCEVVAVDGDTIEVRGLDAVDGTPVLDLKPYLAGFAPRTEVREPEWAEELMRDYW